MPCVDGSGLARAFFGYNTPAWFFILWHTTFGLSILAYALLKDKDDSSVRSPTTNIAITLTCVFGAMAALTWLVTTEVGYLPSFYTPPWLSQDPSFLRCRYAGSGTPSDGRHLA